MKKLGFGLMRLPLLDKNKPDSIDLETLNKMVDSFIDRGFTYFDTAWMYCGFASENAAKAALVDRHPRDSFTLATKLHAEYFDSVESREELFQKQLEKTGAGYFDYYLLHDASQEHLKVYEELDCFSWLREKKESGIVKHIGFSYHDSPELLDRILTQHPEMEFVQLQINYLDWESPKVQSRRCYETAIKHGKKVVIMEPVKGGTLAKLPEKAEKMLRSLNPEASIPSWAIRFAASLEGVMMVLSGMSNMQQLLENTDTMGDFQPLKPEEKALLLQAAEIIRSGVTVPCTGCSYCTEGCPANIPIPRCFELYNSACQGNSEWRAYKELTENSGKASDCVGCGQCELVCPQHLSVRKFLSMTAHQFEGI